MVTAEHPRDEFVDHHTATQVIATLDMAVKAQRPFFLGVGMIRPHLPFIVPEDSWKQYAEDEIKLPASPLPPRGAPNISLNDQIFQGTHRFCPDGTDLTTDCPSAERQTLETAEAITPFHPFDANNTRFLRHGCKCSRSLCVFFRPPKKALHRLRRGDVYGRASRPRRRSRRGAGTDRQDDCHIPRGSVCTMHACPSLQ